eukprot:gene24553-29866_t
MSSRENGNPTPFFLDFLEKESLECNKVQSDGNCLFRSVADQVFGDENRHVEIREVACNFLAEHRDHFEPFVDDGEAANYDDYLKDMRADGTWGSDIELVALSSALAENLSIIVWVDDEDLLNTANHDEQAKSRLRYSVSKVKDFELESAPYDDDHLDGTRKCLSINLSYHDGMHYNSVRPQNAQSGEPCVSASFAISRNSAQVSRGSKKSKKETKADVKRNKESAKSCGARTRSMKAKNNGKPNGDEDAETPDITTLSI